MLEGVALALTAGMLAAVNPCGFALLPAYLSLLVIRDDAPRPTTAIRRALGLSAVMTGAFVAVFGAFGVLVVSLASSVQRHLPWVTVVVGVLLGAMGLWLLTGRNLPGLPRARAGWAPTAASVPAMLGYGLAYALASLTCTIAPFLAVVVAGFRVESVWAGTALFVTYGLGMGLVVGTAAVAVALARASLVARMRRLASVLPRLVGVLLVVVGAYVAYYGSWEIRVLNGDAGADPVISLAQRVQHFLVGVVDRLGWPGMSVILVLLIAAAVALGWARRRAVDPHAGSAGRGEVSADMSSENPARPSSGYDELGPRTARNPDGVAGGSP